MKRAVFSVAVLLFVGLGTAVVGGPNASDGEMAITSGGSAEATTGVGPDGKIYRTSIETTESSCLTGNQSTGIRFGEFSESGNFTRIEFSGTVQTPNPCHEVTLDVSEESSNVYRVDIKEVSRNGTCVTCLGGISFEGYFEAKDDYRLEVFHEGDNLFNKSTEGFSTEEPENTGFWRTMMQFLNSLFN